MSLEEVLREVVGHIKSGSLNNETAVKEWVIRPILHKLDWNDPAEFCSEFSTDSGRVDYALLRSDGTPLVFIEAKAPGRADDKAEEQVFQYAVNRGVPFLIVTDGNGWGFYLSMAEGPPVERRFYRAELTREERIPEYVEFLETHLRKEHVISGKARVAAEERHESNKERKEARDAIPGAWRALLDGPDEMLRDLLAEEVENQCGTKPDAGDVEKFLKDSETAPPAGPTGNSPVTQKGFGEMKTTREKKSKIVGFVFENEEVICRAAGKTLAEVLKVFAGRDPVFMGRFAAETVNQDNPKRRLIARKREDLYVSSPNLRHYSIDLGNGWWLGTNYTTFQIREYIETACKVAGVKFGSELKLIEK